MSSICFPESPPVFACAQKLLQRMIAPWPRRGSSLLELGCNEGLFLRFFWESGFDVSGIATEQYQIDKTRERLGRCAELHLGVLDALPFDDNDFDYVVIPSALIYHADPHPILTEAMRVAARGVLIGYYNQYSAFWISQRFCPSPLNSNLHWHTNRELRTCVRSVAAWSMSSASVLLPPPCLWQPRYGSALLNNRIVPFLGAYAALRLDNHAPRASTPLHVRIKEQIVAKGYDICPENISPGTERKNKGESER